MIIRVLLFILVSNFARGSEISPEFRVESHPWMERAVKFWTRVFTEVTSQESVLHDSKYPDIIYEIVKNEPQTQMEAVERWRAALLLADERRLDPGTLSGDAKKAYEFYKEFDDPDALVKAAHRRRLRVQTGLKDRIRDAWVTSGRYLPKLEELFKQRGVPWEISRIPFIESGFGANAKSPTGALGMWQWMSTTGSRFLKITPEIDERKDPYFSGEASAQLFLDNKEALGNWPVAITAYNHGKRSMARAIRQVGSNELRDIVANYRARNFGFSGKNYFAELVAVLEVEKHPEKYFNDLKREPADQIEEVKLPRSSGFPKLAYKIGVEQAELARLNPSLSRAMISGKTWVPKGTRMWIPENAMENYKKAWVSKTGRGKLH